MSKPNNTTNVPTHHTHVNVMENGRLVWKPKSWLEDLKKESEAQLAEESGKEEPEESNEPEPGFPEGMEQEFLPKYEDDDESASEDGEAESESELFE